MSYYDGDESSLPSSRSLRSSSVASFTSNSFSLPGLTRSIATRKRPVISPPLPSPPPPSSLSSSQDSLGVRKLRSNVASTGSLDIQHTRSFRFRPSSASPSTSSNGNRSASVSLDTKHQSLSSSEEEAGWIYSIVESRSTCKEVGVALIKADIGKCILTQFTDTQMHGHLLHLLSTHPPVLILLPISGQLSSSNSLQGSTADTLHMILQHNTDVKITNVHRKLFNEQEGFDYLQHLFNTVNSIDDTSDTVGSLEGSRSQHDRSRAVLSAVSKKYFALSAASALFKYLENNRRGRLPAGSLHVIFQAPEGIIVIDKQTSKDLELLKNGITGNTAGSLYGTLHHCSTPMGERLLQMDLIQPMANSKAIDKRLDAIEELINHPEKFFELKQGLKACMKKRVDLDKTVTQLMKSGIRSGDGNANAVETTLGHLIHTRHILDSMKGLADCISGYNSALLGDICLRLSEESIFDVVATIDSCINSDLLQGTAKSTLSSRNARMYAVKTGRDSILDAARQTYQENTADALECCQKYAVNQDLPFKIVFSTKYGYSLEIPSIEVKGRQLSSEFINVAAKKGGKALSMTTIELKKCNQRMNDSIQEVFLLSQNAIECLRLEIIRDAGVLFEASEALAHLDIIASLTHCALAGRYTRPRFGASLSITNGRHPILEKQNHSKTIPNDSKFDNGTTFQLLCGPNASGKTTYLKQVALLTIMAHVGSFIPADSACFPPRDCILTRLSNDDEPEANLSTYAREMKTTAFILDTASKNSLVLIDELGRATSTHEGLAIAHAVSEKLIQSKICTIFATHFIHLASTLSPYSNFTSNHLVVSLESQKDGPDSFEYQHRIAPGVTKEEHYGLVSARSCHLPPDLLADAEQMAHKMQRSVQIIEHRSVGNRAASRREAIEKLFAQLKGILAGRNDYSSRSVNRQRLIQLQNDFICKLDRALPPIGTKEDLLQKKRYEDEDSDNDVQMSSAEMIEFVSDFKMRDVA